MRPTRPLEQTAGPAAALFLLVLGGLAPEGAAAGRCEPSRLHPAGWSRHPVMAGGAERVYELYVPAALDGGIRVPVMLDLHGSGSHPRQQAAISRLVEFAERDGFVAVYPVAAAPWPGGGFTWNVPPAPGFPDDVAFIAAVLDDVETRLCVDTARVFAVGFSGGARLASQLACDLSDRIRGVGAVAGLRHPGGCAASRPVPIVAFHGTADPINPYEGGGAAYWGEGVEAAFRGWVGDRGCAADPADAEAEAGALRLSYGACAIELYRIQDGGHTWPGSAVPFPAERFGATVHDLDSTAILLRRFLGARGE